MYENFELTDTNNIFQDILLPLSQRGNKRYFYQLIGIPENGKKYFNELYFLNKKLEEEKFYIKFENRIPLMDVSQIIKEIREAFTFKDLTQLDFVFKKCFSYINNFQTEEVKKCFQKHFLDTCRDWFVETNRSKKITFDMAVNFGVKMLCWTKKVYKSLFFNNIDEIPKVLYYGNIKEQEIYFLEFLFSVGCDILYINTQDFKNKKLDMISKKKVYQKKCPLPIFPTEMAFVPQETSGAKAQQEIEDMYYDNSVLIKPHQFQRHNLKVIPLKFTYEELLDLWKADGNVRPGFEAINDDVYIPTICCKINGIEDSRDFVEKMESLTRVDNCLVFDDCSIFEDKEVLYINNLIRLDLGERIKKFYSRGEFQKEKFRHSMFFEKWRCLKLPLQNMILNLIEAMDTSQFNNRDWKDWALCVAIMMNLKTEILDLLQKYDYGFQVPKIVVFHNGNNVLRKDDSILVTLLWTLGFDILFFSPNGYCDIEETFNSKKTEDVLNIFQLDILSTNFKIPFLKKKIINKESFLERIFKRVNEE